MSRWLKVLPLTLALAPLGIFATSCGSSRNQAQIRFVHAIQDAPALDVDVYGPQQINGMQLFADVGFRGFLPSAGYTNVFSDTDTIKGLVNPNDTTSVFSDTVSWSAGLQYTVIATGFSAPAPTAATLSCSPYLTKTRRRHRATWNSASSMHRPTHPQAAWMFISTPSPSRPWGAL